jgi:DNA-3-methyladenine glycosylase
MIILNRDFFSRSPLIIARELLGKVLVRKLDGQILSGRIVETEAYEATNDEAAHGYSGRTKRNSSLFMAAGHAYVHRIHMQHCLDIVTEAVDVPSSVLIRALEPLTGIETMQKLRGRDELFALTSGPGKLAQALAIDKAQDGVDITDVQSALSVVDDGFSVDHEKIVVARRVGISKATEKEYRFYIRGNRFVSKK